MDAERYAAVPLEDPDLTATRMFEYPEYPDLKVTCRDKSWEVHRAIFAPVVHFSGQLASPVSE